MCPTSGCRLVSLLHHSSIRLPGFFDSQLGIRTKCCDLMVTTLEKNRGLSSERVFNTIIEVFHMYYIISFVFIEGFLGTTIKPLGISLDSVFGTSRFVYVNRRRRIPSCALVANQWYKSLMKRGDTFRREGDESCG